MATKETLRARAKIAASFAMGMRVPEVFAKASKQLPLDSEGEISVIVAAPHESAAVTLHRMERLAEAAGTLVSTIGTELITFTYTSTLRSESALDVIDMANGMTVEEWMMKAREIGRTHSYTVSGNEFASELSFATTMSL